MEARMKTSRMIMPAIASLCLRKRRHASPHSVRCGPSSVGPKDKVALALGTVPGSTVGVALAIAFLPLESPPHASGCNRLLGINCNEYADPGSHTGHRRSG